MLKNIVSLTKKLIALKSIQENPKTLEVILDLALSYLNEYTIERFERNGVKSALVYFAKKRPEKFRIILNGHLDIIAGKEYQYNPKIKGNRLYGAGSMDMKGNLACLIMAFKEVANSVSYPIGLQLTTDEEIGGFNSTKYQIEKGVCADFIIAGEPTNFAIVHKAKGIMQVKISTSGKTAHGAYPWKGDNAIWKMNDFLAILKQAYPIPHDETWKTTVNVSRIETTNQAFNKIPDDCTVWLDIRFVPEELKTIKASIHNLLPEGFTLDIIFLEPAFITDKYNESIVLLEKIVRNITGQTVLFRGANGSSDVRHFTALNYPGIEFGPIGEGIGSDTEWVDIPSLEKYYTILKTFLLNLK